MQVELVVPKQNYIIVTLANHSSRIAFPPMSFPCYNARVNMFSTLMVSLSSI